MKRDNYEELENEDIEQEINQSDEKEKVKTGIRFIRFLLLLVMVLSALVLLFANKDKLNIDNFKRLASKIDLGVSSSEKTDMSRIEFDYNSEGVIGVYKDGIARVTGDNLSIIDNMGTQFQSVLTGFTNPAMITTSKYVLTYDRGGNKLIITNSFSVLFEKAFEDNIVDVSMNDSGYFIVITESKAYKNKLMVFDSDFKEIYIINSMSRYIISADISNDNKHLALSCLNVKDSNVIPQIMYYKINEEESLWTCDFEENVAVSVKAKDDGSVCAVFEWGICIFDSKGKEKYRYEFGNKILQCCYIDDGKYNVVVLSESLNGNSEIYVFDGNGKKISDTITDYNALSVDMNSDRIAVASFEKLYVYTATGKIVDERENPNDADAVLFSDKDSVLTISSSDVVYNVIK